MDYTENPEYYNDKNNSDYDNFKTMIDDLKGISKEILEFRKDYNKFVSSSPFKIILEEKDNKFIDSDNRVKVSADWKNASFDKLKLDETIIKASKQHQESTKELIKAEKDNSKAVKGAAEEFKKSRTSFATAGKSAISGLLKGIAGVVGAGLLSAFKSLPQRAINEYGDMIRARNDLMYQYGLKNTQEGRDKADELYKLRFQHKALPFQVRSAPEQRELNRSLRKSAINMGYNTEKSVKAVSDQLIKWHDIFDDINLSSSRLFQNTMRFIDRSGKVTDTIFTKIRNISTKYIVSPDTLEDIAGSYSKYLRVITKSNTAYTKSMTGLIETVGKLEDAGVRSEKFIDQIQSFQYNDISNASSSSMWKRLSVLGIDPYEALTSDDPNKVINMYTEALKEKFKGVDLSKGSDRLYVNTIAQQQLGFSPSEMQDLYDLLLGKSKEDEDESVKRIDDHTAKIAIDMESYYDRATAGWTYIPAIQKAQDELSLKILNNKDLLKFYEEWNDKTAFIQAVTGGFGDIKKVIDVIQDFLIGGGAYAAAKGLFGVIKSAIIGAGSAAAGTGAAVGGATAGTGAAVGGATAGTGVAGAAGIGALGVAASGLLIGGGLGYLIGEDKRKDLESGKSIIIRDDASGEDLVYNYKDGLRHQTEIEESSGVPFDYYYNKIKGKASSAYDLASNYSGRAKEYIKENNIYTRYNKDKHSVLKEYLDNSTDYINRTELPSHAGGLDRVPYDNYLANLHKDERVLTASESKMMDMVMNQSTGIFGNSNIIDDFTSIFTKDGGSDNMFSGVTELTDDIKVQNKNSDELLKSFDPSNKLGMLFNIMDLDTTNKEGIKTTLDNSKKISDNTLSVDGLSGKMKDLTSGIVDLIKEIKELAKSKFGKYSGKFSGNLLSIADKIINENEGNYGSVNPRDNGALSIGKLQWHGNRARNLLKDIYESSPEEFKEIAHQYGADNLINSIKNEDWSNKQLSEGSSEYNAIKAIISTNRGKELQDKLSQSNIKDYIEVGKKFGLKDPKALIYFADLVNQYGTGDVNGRLTSITKTAIENGGTLEALHEAVKGVGVFGEWIGRRNTVYNKLKDLKLGESDDPRRNAIVEAARSALGMKYGLGFEVLDSKDSSNPLVDCSGLVWYAYHLAGLDNIVGSDRNSSEIGTADTMYNRSTKINFDDLLPGDLVFLNNANHVGIYAGNGKVIHASSGRGKVVEDSLGTGVWESAGRLLARGGEIARPTFALVGEGGYKEYVISTDPKFNDRSVDLLGKAASDIGVASLSNTAANNAPQVTEVYVDTDGIIDAVEELTDIVKNGFIALTKKNSPTTPPAVTATNNSIMNYV